MKKKMNRILALALSLTLSILSITGCTKAANTSGGLEKEQTEFTIAFCTWAGYAPLYIAQEKGIFKELGINPSIIIMEDESQYAAAMVSDGIQALGNVLDRDVIHYASGTPEQYLCTMDMSTGGDGIIASEEIQTVDDLAGKTVALDKSATSYFFFLAVLADSNITEDDITIVEMGNSEAGTAFVSGNVDAAVTWEPWLSTAGDREGGHILVTSEQYPKTIIDCLTVNSNFATENPNTVAALEEAWYQSVEYLNENPEESYKIMAEGLSLTEEEIQAECAGITFLGREENVEFNSDETEENVYDIANLAASFWLEKGLIDSADLSGFFGK